MMQQLLVQVSNTSEHVNEDEWQWKVTVDAGDDTATFSVAKVTLQLHPTFTPRRAILARTTFDERNQFESIVYTGWGTFLISIDMELVVTTPQGRMESKTVRVAHMLVFQHGQVHTTRHVLDRNGVVVQQSTGRTEGERTIPASSSSSNSARQQSFPIVSKRSVYLTRLAKTADTPSPCFRPFWHGRLTTDLNLKQPTVRWLSRHKPRDDHVDDGQPGWLTATEYQDVDAVLDTKLELLADLIRASKNTIVYSGAGISVAAGIGQAARGGNAAAAANVDVTAQPTATHRALTALHQHGLLHGWVQQNHDGLPQKAGFPQECINEIHGSWYDPSNPVVLYSGSLKTHEYVWMNHLRESADLVLVLGTSMSGLSADKTATQCAERSKRGTALGMVIVNLQQTLQDGKATLRLFEETDVVFSALLAKLKIALPPPPPPPRGYQPQQEQQQRVLVPYDRHGQRVDPKVGSPKRLMWWDLRPDARVQLHASHNIEGSGQPGYKHLAKKRQPQGVVTDWNARTTGIHMSVQGVSMTLGQWWLEAAQRGGPPSLPVVNVHPEFVQG